MVSRGGITPQRIDDDLDQFVRRHHHQIGKQFQVAGSDADDQRHLVDDPVKSASD
jgi:hypothetical protein